MPLYNTSNTDWRYALVKLGRPMSYENWEQWLLSGNGVLVVRTLCDLDKKELKRMLVANPDLLVETWRALLGNIDNDPCGDVVFALESLSQQKLVPELFPLYVETLKQNPNAAPTLHKLSTTVASYMCEEKGDGNSPKNGFENAWAALVKTQIEQQVEDVTLWITLAYACQLTFGESSALVNKQAGADNRTLWLVQAIEPPHRNMRTWVWTNDNLNLEGKILAKVSKPVLQEFAKAVSLHNGSEVGVVIDVTLLKTLKNASEEKVETLLDILETCQWKGGSREQVKLFDWWPTQRLEALVEVFCLYDIIYSVEPELLKAVYNRRQELNKTLQTTLYQSLVNQEPQLLELSALRGMRKELGISVITAGDVEKAIQLADKDSTELCSRETIRNYSKELLNSNNDDLWASDLALCRLYENVEAGMLLHICGHPVESAMTSYVKKRLEKDHPDVIGRDPEFWSVVATYAEGTELTLPEVFDAAQHTLKISKTGTR